MRAAPAVVLGFLLAAQPAFAQDEPWTALTRWVDAIESHEAGRNDDAVRTIARMPAADFESAFTPMTILLSAAFVVEDRNRAFDDLFAGFAHQRAPELTRAGRAAPASLVQRVAKPAVNRFLKRAAVAHTDAALFYPESQLTSREGTGHLTSDGRGESELGRPWHWMLARSFLHLTLLEWVDRRVSFLEPDSDPDVRLWYQAVANHFWAVRNFTEGLPHIRKAIELFPRDPELQFVRGLIHESQSAPQIQAAVAEQQTLRTANPRMIYIPSVGSAASERREAEDAFRIAIAGEPGHLEARMRLAHLLTFDRRYDEAAKELTIVLAGVEHPWHRYFASLLLGRAEEGRKRPAEARAAYEAAAALFPEAQAPRVAISQIDLRAGDREAAMKMFELLAAERLHEADPWWQYDAVRTPESERAWLLRMRDAFLAVTR